MHAAVVRRCPRGVRRHWPRWLPGRRGESIECDSRPDRLDNPERPRPREEPVNARQGASAREREDEARRDPIRTFGKYLIDEGIATEAELEKILRQVDDDVNQAADQAVAAAKPEKKSPSYWVLVLPN